MQTNRIIAIILIIICFVAAIVGIQRQTDGTFSLQTSDGKDKLEVVRLSGAISGNTSSVGALAIRDRLLELAKETAVKGVLLTINSPGGTVAASKELYEAVAKVREKKPIYVSMLDVAASGGYYTASAAEKIYANSGTLTGSIGVILSGLNAKALLDRVGIEPQTIKTGPYKDILSPYRKLSDGERSLLQELAQNVYQEFIKDVAKGRKLSVEVVREAADGRIFTGVQAQALKLVDAIGTEADAAEALRQAARKRFNLDDNVPLPLRESPGSFQRLLEQALEGRSFSLLAWLSPRAPGMSIEPPLLLIPSWMNGIPSLPGSIGYSEGWNW